MSNQELDKKQKEISELQKTIVDLNSKLKESESLKGNFISNIMNEVYNPFSSIISMADNIISLNEDNIDKAKPMAEIIYREAAQLDFHLKNIFTAATIEAGLENLENSRVSITEIHKSVLHDFHYDINNKNISIESNITDNQDIIFITDGKKLKLIMLNLLSNAIKNCPENTSITVNYEYVEDRLNISILDQGKGISKEEMEMIFDRFKRIDTTINSVTGGTGLGLSVVKALLEMLNGNIDISNEKGTKVLLCIPNQEINENDDSFDDDALLFDEELF